MASKDFETVYMETLALCKTATDGGPDGDTTLRDWLEAGYWDEATPVAMAAEWDALSEA